jgi:hypothetical protein
MKKNAVLTSLLFAAVDEEQLSGDMAGEDKITDSSSLIHPQQVTVHQHSVLRSTAISSLRSEGMRNISNENLSKLLILLDYLMF